MGVEFFRLGLVGYSRSKFDWDEARRLVEHGIRRAFEGSGRSFSEGVLVSGLTNMGIPKLGYEFARAKSIRTVGIAPRRAKRVRCGLFPVDEQIIVGHNFGDESETFIDSIDALLRVGGGPQSRREVVMFREKHKNDSERLAQRLIELELPWLG